MSSGNMRSYYPVSYDLCIDTNTTTLTFSGRVRIGIELPNPVAEVVLDSLDLEITSCRIGTGEQFRETPFTVDAGLEKLTVTVPEECSGTASVEVFFNGKLNKNLAGFYQAEYRQDGETRILAVTQFEETDARRAFPCFDEPALKAFFTVHLVTGKDEIAISNAALEVSKPLEDGRVLHTFERTPRMSTYLLFFGVGDFEFLQNTEWRIPIRILATSGKAQYGRESMLIARESLAFFEQFTGIRYPLKKLDLIALPEFAYGAMENFGAISYRENLVLFYPGVTAGNSRRAASGVTAHEVAHMWFGNVVSPATWRYVWLNEAFATYGTDLFSESVHPEWQNLGESLFIFQSRTMLRDGLENTIPVELPADMSIEIDASTAPILYGKGSAILHMMYSWLGENLFQQGVREYLTRYLYSSTDTDGFLEAFEAHLNETQRGILASWFRTPGYPIVSAEREGDALQLQQRRFRYVPAKSQDVWQIPLSVRVYRNDGSSEILQTVMKTPSLSLRIPEDTVAYKINADQQGYFRVSHDENNINQLCSLSSQGALAGLDQFGIIADFAAQVYSGGISLDTFLRYLKAFGSLELIVPTVYCLCGVLNNLHSLIPEKRDSIAEVGKELLVPLLERIGLQPDGSYPGVLVRDHLLWTLFLLDHRSSVDFLKDNYLRFTKKEDIDPDLLPVVLKAGPRIDDKAIQRYTQMMDQDALPAVMSRYLLAACGWAAEPEELLQGLQYLVEKVPMGNRQYMAESVGANPVARRVVWPWLLEHIAVLETMHSYHFGSFLALTVPFCGLPFENEVCRFFRSYVAESERAPAEVIAMSLERLKINSLLLQREGSDG